jgi:hypothetical protein
METDRRTSCGRDGESGCGVGEGGIAADSVDRGIGGGGVVGVGGVGGGGGSGSSEGCGRAWGVVGGAGDGVVGNCGGSRSGCQSAAGALEVRTKRGVKSLRLTVVRTQ